MSRRAGGLVSPVAVTFRERPLAPRPALERGCRVGLVDSMLNPGQDWGQGMLDAVERRLRAAHPKLNFERVPRAPLFGAPSAQWAAAMRKRYKALVTAVGD